jgi:hypothetical protein
MQSIIQIFVVNPTRAGVGKESGKPYEMQDAECALLSDTGEVTQVGVLTLPKELSAPVGAPAKVYPGMYIGTFALKADMRTRKIGAALVGLQPYAVKGTPAPASSKASGAQ